MGQSGERQGMLPMVHEKDRTALENDCVTLCSEVSRGPELVTPEVPSCVITRTVS